MTIGEKIKRRRTKLHISQPELSRRTGVSQSYISEIENGNHIPTATVLAAIAKALKCTTDSLVYDDEKKAV